MAGLIYPADIYKLVEMLKEETDLLISLHSHSTSGMTPISYYTACEAGVDILDTAISPLSWGASQPPTESIVAALKGTPYDTKLDLKLLSNIKKYFIDIREKYAGLIDPISEKVDTDVLLYQLPGGMLSNMVSQLKEQNALDRYHDVLEEMPRVRKDLGYPPLVTPTSQIVGIQAVMNVLNGERYKIVSNEVKDYIKGFYGRPPAQINPKIAKMIIGDEKPIDSRPADLLKPQYEHYKVEGIKKGIIKKDEDILTLAIYPAIATKFLSGEMKEEELLSPKQIVNNTNELEIPTEYSVEVDGDVFDVKIMPTGYLNIEEGQRSPKGDVEGGVSSTMQGMLLKLKVAIGDKVKKGDILAIIEAMKMENDIESSVDGVVENIFVTEGDSINAGDILMVIK